jgi:hypothetical protein
MRRGTDDDRNVPGLSRQRRGRRAGQTHRHRTWPDGPVIAVAPGGLRSGDALGGADAGQQRPATRAPRRLRRRRKIARYWTKVQLIRLLRPCEKRLRSCAGYVSLTKRDFSPTWGREEDEPWNTNQEKNTSGVMKLALVSA